MEARATPIEGRTVVPALSVLALAVLMSIVLPRIDSETSYRHPTEKGDVAVLAGGITLVPAAGWDLASGALAGETRTSVGSTASTELDYGSVTFSVRAAPFRGTPRALLARINRINSDLARVRERSQTPGARYAVTTHQGAVGVAEDFTGATRDASVVAFVFPARGQSPAEGVEVVVSGPRGPMARSRDDIVAMIRSIRTAS